MENDISNIEIIDTTDFNDINNALEKFKNAGAHFTNGTYAYAAEMIVPTTKAGFDYIDNRVALPDDIIVLAINSDASMNGIFTKNEASQKDFDELESDTVRAEKVAIPLAEKFPHRQIVVMFYDEETPTALYDFLAEQGNVNLRSLHKWGYGTNPEGPKIEGAHNFGRVFGFPLPNDTKPVCHDITVCEDQSEIVEVIKLTEAQNDIGTSFFPAPNPQP